MERLETLSALLPQTVRVKDFTDDRLADGLRYLSNDDLWEKVEARLGQCHIQVYLLRREPVRRQ